MLPRGAFLSSVCTNSTARELATSAKSVGWLSARAALRLFPAVGREHGGRWPPICVLSSVCAGSTARELNGRMKPAAKFVSWVGARAALRLFPAVGREHGGRWPPINRQASVIAPEDFGKSAAEQVALADKARHTQR